MADHLPNKEKCTVQKEKIVDYLLNENHDIGKSKARFFQSFGFSTDSFENLKAALIEHGQNRPIIKSNDIGFGPKYTVQCAINTPSGEQPCIETVWIIEQGSDVPRLVTAYPSHFEKN